jgi:hypothetical protein
MIKLSDIRSQSASAQEVDELVAEKFISDCIEQDRLLMKIATQQNGVPTAEQSMHFERQGWIVGTKPAQRGKRILRQELARCMRVAQDKLVVGSSKDRKQLEKHVAATARKLESEGPLIKEEIAKLEQRLYNLERDARTAAKRQSEVEAGLERLRTNVPEEIAQLIRELDYAIVGEFQPGALKTEIDHRNYVLSLKIGTPEMSQFLDAQPIRHKVGATDAKGFWQALPDKWEEYRQKCEAELVELNERLTEYELKRASVEQSMEELKNFYIEDDAE